MREGLKLKASRWNNRTVLTFSDYDEHAQLYNPVASVTLEGERLIFTSRPGLTFSLLQQIMGLVEDFLKVNSIQVFIYSGERRMYVDSVGNAYTYPDWDGKHERFLLSGSFNPLHYGHMDMARFIEINFNARVQFELPVRNADKGLLTSEDVIKRVSQFTDLGRGVWLSKAANFVDKSVLFPNTTFALGADTITRVADPKYYLNSEHVRDDCLDIIKANGCKFLVFERNGKGLTDLPLPNKLLELCRAAEGFVNANISSTELREGKKL